MSPVTPASSPAAARPYRTAAAALAQSPAFDAAVVQLASDLAAFYANHREAAQIFSDVGQLAIVSSVLSLPPAGFRSGRVPAARRRRVGEPQARAQSYRQAGAARLH
jgi:DICT domain-containing protein